MSEIQNAKRAGIYLNGEEIGLMTDITVRLAMGINEHAVVGDDKKVFTEGAQEVSFTFGGLHVDTGKMNYLSPGYTIYDIVNDDGQLEPSGLNSVQLEYAIWNTTLSATPLTTINKIYDEGADDNYLAAQSFIAAGKSIKSGTGSKVKLNMTGSIAGTLHWIILADDAGEPAAVSAPNTYASGNVTALPGGGTTPEWENLGNVTNTNDMTPGEIYWLVLHFDDGDDNGDTDNCIGWSYGDTDTYQPQVYNKTSSAEQIIDQAKTHFSSSDDDSVTWTPNGSYLDQLFLLIFDSDDLHYNISVRLVDKAGATHGWIILTDCVFNPEDKDFPENDAISSVYSGMASTGEYTDTYP